MFKSSNTPSNYLNSQSKDKYLMLRYIVRQVENGTGLTLTELKKQYSEERLFAIALKHVTTTKKALCTALNIPIEAGCRYKRTLEKDGNLVQSIDKVICPLTKRRAYLISTNPREFGRLLKSKKRINEINSKPELTNSAPLVFPLPDPYNVYGFPPHLIIAELKRVGFTGKLINPNEVEL